MALLHFFILSLRNDSRFDSFGKVSEDLSLGVGGKIFEGTGIGFAFKRGRKAQFLIGKAIQEMLYNCSYKKIFDKYFPGIEDRFIPEHCKR